MNTEDDGKRVEDDSQYPDLVTVKAMFEEKVAKHCEDRQISFASSFCKITQVNVTEDGMHEEIGQSFNVGNVNVTQDPTAFIALASIIINDRKMFSRAKSVGFMRHMVGDLSPDKEYNYANDLELRNVLVDGLDEVAHFCQDNNITMAVSILLSRQAEGGHAMLNGFGICKHTPANFLLSAYLGSLVQEEDSAQLMEVANDWYREPNEWMDKYKDIIQNFVNEAESGIREGTRDAVQKQPPTIVDQKHLLDEGIAARFNTVVGPMETDFMKNLLDFLNKNKLQ